MNKFTSIKEKYIPYEYYYTSKSEKQTHKKIMKDVEAIVHTKLRNMYGLPI